MAVFLTLGILGLAILVVSLVLGDFGLPDPLGGDVLSAAAVAAFLAAFGFAGAIALGSTGTAVATVVGLAAGVAAGGLAVWLTRTLNRDQTDPTPRSSDLVGARGTVVSPVPSEGYGEISVVVHGHLTKLNARSEEPIAAGTAITVVATLSATSVMVEPVPSTPAR
jgi:membrane protein implicated in regulation of membrane protease activity